MSSYGSAEDRELGQRAGFEHYLTEPFDFNEAQCVLADWAALNISER